MSASNSKNKNSKKPKKSLVRKIIIITSVIALVLVYDVLIGGNIRFYSKWIECGQKPVPTKGSGFMNAGAIHYFEAPNISLIRPSIEYFCTPLEAEKAGYSASKHQYEFPHLEKRNSQQSD